MFTDWCNSWSAMKRKAGRARQWGSWLRSNKRALWIPRSWSFLSRCCPLLSVRKRERQSFMYIRISNRALSNNQGHSLKTPHLTHLWKSSNKWAVFWSPPPLIHVLLLSNRSTLTIQLKYSPTPNKREEKLLFKPLQVSTLKNPFFKTTLTIWPQTRRLFSYRQTHSCKIISTGHSQSSPSYRGRATWLIYRTAEIQSRYLQYSWTLRDSTRSLGINSRETRLSRVCI